MKSKAKKWSPTAKAVVPEDTLLRQGFGGLSATLYGGDIRRSFFSHSSTGKPVVFCEGG